VPRLALAISDRETGLPLFASSLPNLGPSKDYYNKEFPIAATPWNLHLWVTSESSVFARVVAGLNMQNLLSGIGLSVGFLLILGIVGRALFVSVSRSILVAFSGDRDRDLVELQVLQQHFKESLFNLRQVAERIAGINEIVSEEDSLAEAHRYCGLIRQELEGLRELISIHGEFAKSDLDKQAKTDFSLSELMRSCVEGLKLRASGRQNKILWREVEPLPALVRGSQTILRQSILSGLEIVLSFARPGSNIRVDTLVKDGIASFQLVSPFHEDGNVAKQRHEFSDKVKRLNAMVQYLKGHSEHSLTSEEILLKISIPLELVEKTQGTEDREAQDDIVHIVEYLMEHPMRVLVVEDVVLNSTLLKRMLEKWNCAVEIANDGQVAVDSYTADQNFDLVLMDLEMPIMNGIEATRHIRAFEKEGHVRQIPIVALTGHSDKTHEEACRKVGMNGYLTKPVNGKHLGRLLYELKRRQKSVQV
jgi:CheY-like chemotaxis protein